MGEGGTEFGGLPKETAKLPHYEKALRSTTPALLLAKWNQEKPWESIAPGKIEQLYNKARRQPQLNESLPEIYFDPNPKLGQEDKIQAHGKRRDVRGWILKELGLSDTMINNPPLDPLKSQELIARGLGISAFHAAILDHATRNTAGEEAEGNFTRALEHPETFAKKGLAGFVKIIERLDQAGWTRVATEELPRAINQLHFEKQEREMKEKKEEKEIYMQALEDRARAALEKVFGEKDPPQKEALRLVKVRGMQIHEGSAIPADIPHIDELHRHIPGVTRKQVAELIGNFTDKAATNNGDFEKWEKQFKE
ncbi:MAG TPA: hypothetical protein VE090_06530 [Methylomirabilota bacterium]|nr:hypothetical protein [Methylomirabilota bacterium]